MAKQKVEVNPFEREAAVKAKAQKDLDKFLALHEASVKQDDDADAEEEPEEEPES